MPDHRKLTPNRAAAAVRSEIQCEMVRLEEKTKQGIAYEAIWEQLRIFIDGMAQRASAKKGGLGRK
jgi:hypothetical protein